MADTDRELLELAAKAAGYKILEHHQSARDALVDPATASLWIDGVSTGWNPLKDDGHALRLAVQLRMLIEPARTMSGTFVEVHAYPSGRGDCSGVERLGQDDCAATRRAIVRAAAAIGGGK